MATHKHTRAAEFAYHFVGDVYTCAYCGDPADTEDHTVPCWYAACNVELLMRCKLYKVSACRDCNVRASSIVDRTFLARKKRIAKSIRKRFVGLLGCADWAAEDLDELGPRMRDYVRNSIHGRRHLIARLQFLEDGLMPQGMPPFFFSHINSGKYGSPNQLPLETL